MRYIFYSKYNLTQIIRSLKDLEITNVIEKNISETFLNDMIQTENVKQKGRGKHNDVNKICHNITIMHLRHTIIFINDYIISEYSL